MLENLPFYPYLTENERLYLTSAVRTQAAKRGEVIHAHNADCLGLLTVLSGTVSVSALSDEGKEVTVFLLRKGDTCVLSAACIMKSFDADVHFLAETNASLSILPAAPLNQVMHENLRVECEIYKMASTLFGRVMQAMQRLLFFSIPHRIADFLLQEAGGKDGVSVRLTHEQLAKYIGSAREVVTLCLKRFQENGYVTLSYGTVTITNAKGLKKEALKP